MTIDYILDTYKKKNGLQAIRLRVTIDRKRQYFSSGESVRKNQWNDKKSTVVRHPLELQINAKLNSFKNEVHSFALKNEGVSSKQLLHLWKNREKDIKGDFYKFYQSIADESREKGNISSAITFESSIKSLQSYSPELSFRNLNEDFILSYKQFLFKKGNKLNTVAGKLKYLKIVVKKAIVKKLIETNPFENIKIVSENTEKNTLSFQEIQRVKTIKIESRHKGQILARDMFLLAFYCAGMRFGDICRLKWSNISENNISYVMNKSKKRSGSKREIPITPGAREILDKYRGKHNDYVFRFLQGVKKDDLETIFMKIKFANNAVNRSWKIFCSNNGFSHTTFHCSKHSFADYCVHSGIDVLTISKLLGHERLHTTQIYLKDFYKKQENDALIKMFG